MKAKESAGISYWKSAFREMAERNSRQKFEVEVFVRGASEHIKRIERGRVERDGRGSDSNVDCKESNSGRESDSIGSSSEVLSGKESECTTDSSEVLSERRGDSNLNSLVALNEMEGDVTIDSCMRDDEDELLLIEVDKLLRLEKVRVNTQEWKVRNDERNVRKLEYESERKMKLKQGGERKREWILKAENNEKVRFLQAIIKGVVDQFTVINRTFYVCILILIGM